MDWAANRQKLSRIMDKMPGATEEQIKAEYVENGGLLNKEDEAPVPGVSVTRKVLKKIVKTVAMARKEQRSNKEVKKPSKKKK